MTAVEALQSVQYVTVKGRRLAVLSAEDWEALIEWIETLEDVDIARQALAELRSAAGDRQRAGWLGMEGRGGPVTALAVRKRPPYDYGDLESLLDELK